MNFRHIAIAALLLFSATAHAGEMGAVPLSHRAADELLPLLTPFLGEGERATTGRGEIILEADTERLHQLSGLVRRLDRPARTVTITLREGALPDPNRRRLHVGGTEPFVEAVRTEEGRWAHFAKGDSTLEVKRGVAGPRGSGVELERRERIEGFAARADLVEGEAVIQVKMEREFPTGAGATRIESLESTLRGAPGEWLRVGGVAAPLPAGRVYTTRKPGEGSYWIQVVVE